MVMDKERDTAMNYLHNNNCPPRSAIYSCTFTLSRTHSRNAPLYFVSSLRFFVFFFSLTLITLHRNIFVLGPAQLCISRNDDGSYDVTVLAGRQELRSLNRNELSEYNH